MGNKIHVLNNDLLYIDHHYFSFLHNLLIIIIIIIIIILCMLGNFHVAVVVC